MRHPGSQANVTTGFMAAAQLAGLVLSTAVAMGGAALAEQSLRPGAATALVLPPLEASARERGGDVYLVLELASYRPADTGGAQIVVRRTDDREAPPVARLTIFPVGAFPTPAAPSARRYQIRLGTCRSPADWTCNPQLEVTLDAGVGRADGAIVTLGKSRLEID